MNGIDYEAQDIIVEDVFHYFKYAVKKNLKFDLVILDPPSFARSKKVTFSAAKDYTNLLKQAITITEDHGVIVASTNSATFDMKKGLKVSSRLPSKNAMKSMRFWKNTHYLKTLGRLRNFQKGII